MAPQDHLHWFADNIEWLQALPVSQLDTPVPNCPGWDVVDVLNHLSLGLGLAYPVAMSTPPHVEAERVFDDVAWPTDRTVGQAAIERFETNLAACLHHFQAADPDQPCWTYAGPGRAAFWFRRAAIETTLHRIDVAEALATDTTLSPTRAHDAIVETLEFALPLASTTTTSPSGSLRVESPELDLEIDLEIDMAPGARHTSTDNGPAASISGTGQAVLCALWGRASPASEPAAISITGNLGVADEWLTLIERAFAGR